LKGERCLSPKCPMVKRAYPPGEKRKRKGGGLSEYGKELREKQKLKNWYNLQERQFRNYVKQILEKRGRVQDAGVLLIRKLERRLDNVVFRLGFTSSRNQARQLIVHGHFLVNGSKVKSPAYQVRKEDKISFHPRSVKMAAFKNLSSSLKKYQPPSWLELDIKNLEGKVVGEPSLEEAGLPAEISSIFEFYSR